MGRRPADAHSLCRASWFSRPKPCRRATRGRRLQGDHLRRQGRRRLLGIQVGRRNAPCSAGPADGVAGADPHVDGHGGRHARGGGGRGRDRRARLKIDVYRSTGQVGRARQHDRLGRANHVQAGVVVAMQDEKSQLQNKAKVMRVLRARACNFERARQRRSRTQRCARRSAPASGRKIRTYNYAESRVTDHRVKLTQHRLDAILEGEARRFHRGSGR